MHQLIKELRAHYVGSNQESASLYSAPITPHAQRIFDIGTGTGLWAIQSL